jgi:hypothetical protein
MPPATIDPPPLDTPTIRELAVEFQVDPRSIKRERDNPGSVRGMAGHRARRALASLGSERRGAEARNP